MPHINLPAELPGIRGPMAFRPETARPLNDLVAHVIRAWRRDAADFARAKK